MMVDAFSLADAVAAHDLIIANTLVAWRAIHLAKAFGKPSLLWVHESHWGSSVARTYPPVAAALAQADHVVLPAQVLIELYRDFLVEGRYSVLPYGLDPAMLQIGDIPTMTKNDRLRVVHVGSLEARKGQDFLLQSLATLDPQARDQFEVYLVGRTLDPKFEAALTKMANSLPNVHFAGEVSHAQTLAYLRSADIFVLPSRDEVLPVSMLEAMFYRKAIIATDVGGVAEAIEDGVNGILVDFGAREQLAGALAALGQNRHLLKGLGQNAYLTFLQRYAGDRFGEAFVSLLNTVLETHDRQAVDHQP
jgi:glycosyltransferase involved in cell wall biosynthesis